MQALVKDLYSKGGIVGSGFARLIGVDILHVTCFGANKKSGEPIIGLMTIKLSLIHSELKTPIPGVVFLRADAVALIVTEFHEGEIWTLLVRQPRAPSGKFMLEAVAEMLQKMERDNENLLTLTGTAIKE